MIRVVLPSPLRALARTGDEISLDLDGRATQRSVIDEIERRFPELRGTLRDRDTQRRRAFVRLFACERDLSHDAPDDPLPDEVSSGAEPLLIVGAMAGG